MRVNSSVKAQAREYSGFILLATFIVSLVWLVHSSAASSNPLAKQLALRVGTTGLPPQRPKPTPLACSTCGVEGPQTIYAPLIELPESSGTEINLNCRSPHVMEVTPTFYTQRGEAFGGNSFQMQPAEVKTVDLKTLMPRSIRERHDWGGMTLSYTGGILEMWGQLRLMNVNQGNSVDVTFTILQDKRSDVRNAVWWMPEHAEAIIALGNLGNSAIRAIVKFSNGDNEQVEVPAHGTRLIRRRSEQFRGRANGEGEAVTIKDQGTDGNLITAGAVTAMDGGFTSSIRFYDTQNVAQPNLYATNFRLKHVKPRMLLRNTGTETIAATPRFIPVAGDPNSFIDLPSMSLRPNEIADVDLEPLKGAVSGRSDFDDVSVQMLNTGSPGSLIGALNGQDETKGMTYDVPLRDMGGIRNSTGAYPWRLDHDLSTVVSITNVAPVQSEVVVQINYPGGPYLLNPRRLAAGETAIYDLKKIRDQRISDRNGHTIPLSVTGGQFKWFIHGAGSGRLIGRAEMLGSFEGISSSYSCPGGNCPAMFSYAFIDPDDVFLEPDDTATVYVNEVDCDAYGCIGPFSPYVTGWSLYDPDFAVLFYGNGSTAYLVGLLGGTADYQANIQYDQYAWDGLECIYGGVNYTDTSGEARVLKVDSISPDRALIGSTLRITISGRGFGDSSTTSVEGDSGLAIDNVNNFSVNDTQISANMTIATNAAPGQHTITVHVGDEDGTVQFFVQIPKALQRLDFPGGYSPTQESKGIGPLVTLTDGSVLNLSGSVVDSLTHKCGAYRNLLYQLVDQDQTPHPINAVVTVVEAFPANEETGDHLPSVISSAPTNANGFLGDVNGLVAQAGSCAAAPATSGSSKQHFSVTISGTKYDLTTVIKISISYAANGIPQYTITNEIITQ